MSYSKNLIGSYSLFLILSTTCMDPIQSNQCKIKTSDGKVCQLPQWQIERSRKLHKQQALHYRMHIADSFPLLLKKIDQEKLMLFSAALEAEKFDVFFNKLNPSLKNKLICIAGKQELASPILTLILLQQCISPHIIKKHIDPHFAYIIDTMKQQIILDNFENNHIIQKSCDSYLEHAYYASKNYQAPLEFNSYDTLPEILKEKTNFNGITLPMICRLSEQSPDIWLINNQINGTYIITPTKPINQKDPFAQTRSIQLQNRDANKNYLWTFIDDEISIKKTLTLTNPIENSLFSNNGKYLAIWSGSELVLISLVAKDTALTCHNLFLTEHTGKVKTVCFNEQSTLFAYSSDNSIYFWDTQKKQLLQQLSLPDHTIDCICINNLDNRMAVIAFDKKTRNYILTLLDCTNISELRPINHFSFSSSPVTHNSLFTPCGEKILIREKKMITILDAISGKILSQIESHKNNAPTEFSILIPHTNILISGQNNLLKFNNLDSHKDMSLVLEDKNSSIKIPLCGIGCTSEGRIAVALYRGFKMIAVELFNEKTWIGLIWMNDNLNLIQKYLLLRLYHKRHSDDNQELNLNYLERSILTNLPTEPCNVKEMVEKYLLKNKNKKA